MLWWMSFLLNLLSIWQIAYARGTNFTFDYGPVGQCDDFYILWQGGTAPFELTLVPSKGSQENFQIPDSSFINGHGTFSTPVKHAEGVRMLAVMSDATGFGTGGVSPVITVGPSVSKNECNTTEPAPDFTFSDDSHVTQCSPYTFNYYADAVLPVTIIGMIPGGQVFYILVSGSVSNYTWIPDLAPETTVTFMMQDSKGRTGGAAEFIPVNPGNDSCLTTNSPSSQKVVPSSTVFQSSTSSQTLNSVLPSSTSVGPSETPSTRTNVVPLAGGLAGGVVVIAAMIVSAWFWLMRKRHSKDGASAGEEVNLLARDAGSTQNTNSPSPEPPVNVSTPLVFNTDPAGTFTTSVTYDSTPNIVSNTYNNGPVIVNYAPVQNPAAGILQQLPSFPNPFLDPPSYVAPPSQGVSASGNGNSLQSVSFPSETRPDGVLPPDSSIENRPAVSANTTREVQQRAPRPVIVHTDMNDEVPELEDEVIELPPQYRERRRREAPRVQVRAVDSETVSNTKGRRIVVNGQVPDS